MLKNMLKFLKGEHDGSEGFEATLVFPLIFITFIILLYFFFMAMTYISYNNVANSIAQELNMRQTGYQTAMDNYATMPNVYTYRVRADGNQPTGALLPASKVSVSPSTSALRSGTYFALDKHKGQFIIPFTELTGVKVTTTKPINVSSGKKLAGTVIKVEIYYRTMVYGGSSPRPLINMTAVGYNIIG